MISDLKINDYLLNINTDVYEYIGNKLGYFNYEPTSYAMLDKLFRLYPFEKKDSFVEMGCGLGRVIFTAAFYGCNNVVGIEINDDLFSKLLFNKNNFLNKHNFNGEIKLIKANAELLNISSEMNKFFFFNPFHLKYFVKTINNVERSYDVNNRLITIFMYLPHESYIKYLNNYSRFKLIDEVFIENYLTSVYQII